MMPKGCTKSKMHRPKFQTAGWAAFDREHREKQGIGVEDVVDPFPSISKNPSLDMIESSNCFKLGNNLLPAQSMQTRSFSSVVLSATLFEFPSLKTHTKIGASDINNDDSHVVTVKSNANPVEMLKDVHSWADQYLIEDILAAVNNDVRQASTLLKEMTSFETKIKNVHSEFSGISLSAAALNWSEDRAFLEENSSIVDTNVSEDSYKELISKQFYVPSEPEWEEDDIYLSHRKEALKKMRAGSQHSRAASNAYMRGDHLSAQQLSSRAREEWMDAKKLNAQAAEEILRIRNSNNDIWKLDLHGLHATEAVYALARHLEELECIMMMNHSSSSNELAKIKQIHENSSFDSIDDGFETTGYSKGNIVPQQRQTFLHVITGTGNHSKGQAALPAAVRSFLVDEGYRFDDARPGVISVRLKFRYK